MRGHWWDAWCQGFFDAPFTIRTGDNQKIQETDP
jgi:hypothetical protein